MSAKPTPGPHFVRARDGGHAVEGIHGVTVGWFSRGSVVGRDGSHHISTEEAEANARSWVDGIAALETLSKIRAVEREWSESRANAGPCMAAIAKILDEAKP